MTPCVKWAGGKRQLLPKIRQFLPPVTAIGAYCEPFLGGGAVLFDWLPPVAIVNDANAELMNVYRVIRSDVQELIALLNVAKNTIDGGLTTACRGRQKAAAPEADRYASPFE